MGIVCRVNASNETEIMFELGIRIDRRVAPEKMVEMRVLREDRLAE